MKSLRTSAPLVKLERCSVVLDGVTVLDDITFELRAGQRWALIGSNGAGKTMLLKLLRGDLWPTPLGMESRTYHLDPDAGPEGSSQPAGSKQNIAYIGPERQDRYLRRDWNLTVAQVVTTGLFDEDIPLTRANRAQSARVTRLLNRFALSSLRRRRFLTLSYGQRRRVLVARALAGDPKVLLLDEVFNGLDKASSRLLRAALEQPGSRGPAWILSTHRAVELPSSVTHVAHVRAGRIVSAGPVGGDTSTAPVPARRRAMSAKAIPAKRAAVRQVDEPLVRIRKANVFRDYRPVLKDLDWTLDAGEHWAVTGRNGSGKSTLLMMIHGDLHPALGGTVERRGVPFGTHIEAWKKRVGFVSPELQAEHFRAQSIEEIVISGRYASVGLNDAPTRADRRAAQHWLAFFGLEALAARRPGAVSYGQLRLALIARAMVLYPELLLLDEPFTGLDADLHDHVLALIDQLAQGGTQIVMAVHHEADVIPSVNRVLRILPGGKTRVDIR
ncbi:MAG: ATP-binding cassette domain-containing protein [Steroidobacteraceae bacterium]